jgi:hypothetical protein
MYPHVDFKVTLFVEGFVADVTGKWLLASLKVNSYLTCVLTCISNLHLLVYSFLQSSKGQKKILP